MTWLLHYIGSFLASSLTYYDPPSRRLSNWRQDCSCVGDISSWQDGQ